MERVIIKGNRALAKELQVHYMTVQNWRKNRILEPATLAEYGRTIIYDLEKVFECLHHKKVTVGRRVSI